MALVSDNLRKCSVKISLYVKGVPSYGSGIIYETPSYCDYNYVLTAKHILKEESQAEYNFRKITGLTISHIADKKLTELYKFRKRDLEKNIITFVEDFAILIIDKDPDLNFIPFIVSDDLKDEDVKFFSWATFTANENDLHFFNFERNDHSSKRVKLLNPPSPEALPGISGAGIFINNKNVLYGIICNYPNNNFELSTIDCAKLSFSEINQKLKSLNKIELDTETSKHKREVQNFIVDIHQARINDVRLDLGLARNRLKADIIDDWYHDPLKYIDLLSLDHLFKQFESYFNNNTYKASLAEHFYVPKKKFTLRQALVSPFVDRIMYMAVVGVLAERLEDAMIPNVYSARYNKFHKKQLLVNGVEQWKKMQYALYAKAYEKNAKGDYAYNCIVEIDLLNFYDNVNKSLLIKKIKRVCETSNEKKACNLLEEILRDFSRKDSGLPQNSDASALLATFYLNQVDVFMQNSSFAYYRFMDDIRIFCSDKYEARRILQDLEYELRRCHLSVNSQKTKIFTIINEGKINNENFYLREKFKNLFDLELSKISRFRKASNYAYQNQAFHQSILLLKNNINEDLNTSEESAKKLNYALNTIEILGRKNINLFQIDSDLESTLFLAVKQLVDKPWITTQVCKVLNLLDTEILKKFSPFLKEILTNKKYNTYSFQTYQVWLVLAKHKILSEELIRYAVRSIEKNDETNKPVIAAMIIYICSVDQNYKRVILRKFDEGFTSGYFQNRITLIALRTFDSDLISTCNNHDSLKHAHQFTNIHKNKDLVYVQGFEEETDADEHLIDQLFSL